MENRGSISPSDMDLLSLLPPDIWSHLIVYFDWKSLLLVSISSTLILQKVLLGAKELPFPLPQLFPLVRRMSNLHVLRLRCNISSSIARDLPRRLRSLMCPQFEDALDLALLPSGLDSLHFAHSHSQAIRAKGFPATLTSFKSTRWGGWTAQEFALLPKTLLSLHVACETTWRPFLDEAFSSLPRSITSLYLRLGDVLSDVAIGLLPQQLEELVLWPKLLLLTAFGVSKLPSSLQRIELPTAHDGPCDTLQVLRNIKTTRQEKEVKDRLHKCINNRGLKWPFPVPTHTIHLTILDLPSLRHPTEESLWHLPATTLLRLNLAQARVRHPMEFLGRLTHLNQLTVRVIYKSDVPYLPQLLRSLTTVASNSSSLPTTTAADSSSVIMEVDDYNVLLDDADAKHLPKTLAQLEIHANFSLRSLFLLSLSISSFAINDEPFAFPLNELMKIVRERPLFEDVTQNDTMQIEEEKLVESGEISTKLGQSLVSDDSTYLNHLANAVEDEAKEGDPMDSPLICATSFGFLVQPEDKFDSPGACRTFKYPFNFNTRLARWIWPLCTNMSISLACLHVLQLHGELKRLSISDTCNFPPRHPLRLARASRREHVPTGTAFPPSLKELDIRSSVSDVEPLLRSLSHCAPSLSLLSLNMKCQFYATLDTSFGGDLIPSTLTELSLELSMNRTFALSLLWMLPPQLRDLHLKECSLEVPNQENIPPSVVEWVSKMGDDYLSEYEQHLLQTSDDSRLKHLDRMEGRFYFSTDAKGDEVSAVEDGQEARFAPSTTEPFPPAAATTSSAPSVLPISSPGYMSKMIQRITKRFRRALLQETTHLPPSFWMFCIARVVSPLSSFRLLRLMFADATVEEMLQHAPAVELLRRKGVEVEGRGIERSMIYSSTTACCLPEFDFEPPATLPLQPALLRLLGRAGSSNSPTSSRANSSIPALAPSSSFSVPSPSSSDHAYNPQPAQKWTDESIAQLSPYARELDASNCSALTWKSFKSFPTSLTRVFLPSSQNITDDSILALPRGLKDLILGSTQLTDACVVNLPPNLLELVIRCDFSDEVIANLPRTLKVLNMGSNTRMSDASISSLPPFLERLNLLQNTRLTDAAMERLPRSLAHLNLYGNSNITDAGIAHLPAGLTYLNLSNSQIGNNGISNMPRGLVELILIENTRITDAGLLHLPRTLTHLRMRKNQQITGMGLRGLPIGMRSLHVERAHITEDDLLFLPPWITELTIDTNIEVTSIVLRCLPYMATSTTSYWSRVR